MNSKTITLDHALEIVLDPSNPPFSNYQAFQHNYAGLKILADSVREFELKVIADDPHAANVTLYMSSNIHPMIPCSFNWFSVTIVNYLRLVALVQLMNINKWKSADLIGQENAQVVKSHCREYVKNAVPELYKWRNKVAAHFAATDPFKDDTLGTLEQSIMNPVTYKYPYYQVGLLKWNTQGSESELPTWALTQTYENLQSRFWPEMKLKQFS